MRTSSVQAYLNRRRYRYPTYDPFPQIWREVIVTIPESTDLLVTADLDDYFWYHIGGNPRTYNRRCPPRQARANQSVVVSTHRNCLRYHFFIRRSIGRYLLPAPRDCIPEDILHPDLETIVISAEGDPESNIGHIFSAIQVDPREFQFNTAIAA